MKIDHHPSILPFVHCFWWGSRLDQHRPISGISRLHRDWSIHNTKVHYRRVTRRVDFLFASTSWLLNHRPMSSVHGSRPTMRCDQSGCCRIESSLTKSYSSAVDYWKLNKYRVCHRNAPTSTVWSRRRIHRCHWSYVLDENCDGSGLEHAVVRVQQCSNWHYSTTKDHWSTMTMNDDVSIGLARRENSVHHWFSSRKRRRRRSFRDNLHWCFTSIR